MIGECPKCDFVSEVDFDECPKCGFVPSFDLDEDDGQPSDLQENEDFAHDGYADNMEPNEDGSWS